jgi:hypothetical protein
MSAETKVNTITFGKTAAGLIGSTVGAVVGVFNTVAEANQVHQAENPDGYLARCNRDGLAKSYERTRDSVTDAIKEFVSTKDAEEKKESPDGVDKL